MKLSEFSIDNFFGLEYIFVRNSKYKNLENKVLKKYDTSWDCDKGKGGKGGFTRFNFVLAADPKNKSNALSFSEIHSLINDKELDFEIVTKEKRFKEGDLVEVISDFDFLSKTDELSEESLKGIERAYTPLINKKLIFIKYQDFSSTSTKILCGMTKEDNNINERLGYPAIALIPYKCSGGAPVKENNLDSVLESLYDIVYKKSSGGDVDNLLKTYKQITGREKPSFMK